MAPGLPKLKKKTLDRLFDDYCTIVIEKYKLLYYKPKARGKKVKEIPLTKERILSRSRLSGLVYLRFMFVYYVKHNYDHYSLKSIGELLSGRDHTSVLHANAEFQNMLDCNYQVIDLTTEGAVKDYELISSLL
jgi:Bacterial dnaA protein helix-turn-helix